jgi:CRISPR-associated protein Cas1
MQDNVSPSNPDEPPIRVMAIHALAYCERLFYLEEIEEIREADDRVYAGRKLHEERVPKLDDESRELRSFEVSSDELGLFGKVDAARVRGGQWVVYEHKKGRCRRANDKSKTPEAWPSDRLQVSAYTMLLEHQMGKPITEARIRYHKDNVTVTLDVDENARQAVRDAVQRMRFLRHSSQRPPVTDNERLCLKCSLRVVCLPEEERLVKLTSASTSDSIDKNSDDPPKKTNKAKLFPARRDRRTLHITTVPAKVGRSNRTFVIDIDGTVKKVPVEQVDAILLYGGAQITSQAVQMCSYENVAVQWISGGGRVLSSLQPPGRVRQRIRQYEALTQPEFCIELARRTVLAKVQFQLQYLLRGTRSSPDARDSIENDLRQIRNAIKNIDSCESLDRLRGLEGIAAKAYFGSFSTLLNERVPASLLMKKRTKHPPRDRINCLLSFGYSMIFGLVQRTALGVGLEPAFGYFHQPRTTASPLVMDVMEIFRTPLWEMPLVGSLNRGQWHEVDDFEIRPGHVWLSDEGRKKAIALFECRLSESYQHPYTGQSLEYGRMVELEMRLLEKEWTGCPGLFGQLRIR